MGLFYVRYVRYMDDILALTARRWKLRAAVHAVNQELDALKLEKNPHKTFIGRIEKGSENHRELYRTYNPALRARPQRAGARATAWSLRATLGGWVQDGLARG